MSSTMTIRLDDSLKARLDHLAAATNRSKSFLAAQAVKEFVELNEWQIQEIHQAIHEANAGDFATDESLEEIKSKWL